MATGDLCVLASSAATDPVPSHHGVARTPGGAGVDTSGSGGVQPSRPVRGLAVTLVLALTVAATACAGKGEEPVSSSSASPAAMALPDEVMPAAAPLRLLHQRAAAALDTPASGRYAFVHVRLWAADSTLGPGRAAAVSIVEFEEWRWRAADGSGRTTTARTSPPQTTATTDHGPGELAFGPDPLPTDPAALIAVLHRMHPPVLGPAAIVRAVADVGGWHTFTRDQRLAILDVLADTDGPTWLGTVADRADRRGVAVAYDDELTSARDMLILDPDTGDLLAYQHTATPRTGMASAVLPAEQYLLYLTRGRVSATGTIVTASVAAPTAGSPTGTGRACVSSTSAGRCCAASGGRAWMPRSEPVPPGPSSAGVGSYHATPGLSAARCSTDRGFPVPLRVAAADVGRTGDPTPSALALDEISRSREPCGPMLGGSTVDVPSLDGREAGSRPTRPTGLPTNPRPGAGPAHTAVLPHIPMRRQRRLPGDRGRVRGKAVRRGRPPRGRCPRNQ